MESLGVGKAGLAARVAVLAASEPEFARFLAATAAAADPADLAVCSLAALEAMARRAHRRLDERVASHQAVSHHAVWIEPVGPARELIEVHSLDMPFIVDSVLAAVRAKGGNVAFFAHPKFRVDPTQSRLAEAGDASVSLLLIEIEALGDAAGAALKLEIEHTLTEVFRATRGWRGMLERVKRVIEDWRALPPRSGAAAFGEATLFLGWLAEHNFTFLGLREYRLERREGAAKLVPRPETGIGILEDENFHIMRAGTDYVEMTEQHLAWLADDDPLMVTKANVRARVHRRAHLDYVGVKLYGDGGTVTGELRIVGLFTSHALGTPHTEVPLIRRKIAEVMRRSGADHADHAGKALMAALSAYPRDELFQIDVADLVEFSREIAALADRPRVKVLPRIDRFDNFVSILTFVPRDHFTSAVRERIGRYLAERYAGRISAFYPHFPEGDLVRVHFIIGRDGGATPRVPRSELEADIAELILTFGDRLERASGAKTRIAPWLEAFPAGYQATNSAAQALTDIEVLERLVGDTNLALKLYERDEAGSYGLKVYHRYGPIPLSDRVPMLENFGFRVIDERTFVVTPAGGAPAHIHEMLLAYAGPPPDDFSTRAPLVEEAILAVWRGAAESDGLDGLVLRAGLAFTDVAVLRALQRYLKQVGVSWSRAYLAQVLSQHADVAAALIALFHARFNPDGAGDGEAALARIDAALTATQSLDEDRIIRRLRNLVEALLRTNVFQTGGAGQRRPALAFKFDCAKLDALPEPRPYREIFVYSPRVEGLHLRFGPIARGGLRWSDRPEDFRTEVLGLVKAQQVKNAIIVPVGAKGAFVPRLPPAGGDREAILAEGTACYKIFIGALLDVTDNLVGEDVVPPEGVVRRDGDDPYLVVAADKGTASFSDTANALASARGFWLDDAFASGGSNGYDHKKMGITARGAWEVVKRHFRELDRDIQTAPVSVVGVGDMSGDVFGNGMLLSPEIRLVAAFDHRDIFIDPAPDPAVSLAERQRLFGLPRSSWQDYDLSRLSEGGGIYARAQKNLDLSAAARRVLELPDGPLTPQDVMTAILKAKVDLLWFGGIGTYIRAADESDAAAGDKANDAIRVTGRDLRALVVGEGANLAVTQRGRIEFALGGGRIDSDAIDNSAGVNASDIEVNVKIALGAVVRAGALDPEARNRFLATMTDEVAALCLQNNYLQSLALSLEERRGLSALPDHRELIEGLEASGQLNRAIEFLPDNATLAARAAGGRGLARPELAVLLAYAKNALSADLLACPALDSPSLAGNLYRYFPPRLVGTYREAVTGHRLRREVIATVLANQMINRGGPGFAVKMMAASSADAAQIAIAYCLTRDIYGLDALYTEIDALDGRVSGEVQLALYAEAQQLIEHETLWLLRNADLARAPDASAARYAASIATIADQFSALVPPGIAGAIVARAAGLAGDGVPQALARRVAELGALGFATDIALVAERGGVETADAARVFFGLLDLFGLAGVMEAGERLVLSDRYDRMALDRALANLMRALRDLSVDVLAAAGGRVEARFAAWRASRSDAVARAVVAVAALTSEELNVSRLSVAAGLLSDMAQSA